jgi:hypothetical protein
VGPLLGPENRHEIAPTTEMSARLADVLGTSAPWMLDGITPFHMSADDADGADGADANAALPVVPRHASAARPATMWSTHSRRTTLRVRILLHGASHSYVATMINPS